MPLIWIALLAIYMLGFWLIFLGAVTVNVADGNEIEPSWSVKFVVALFWPLALVVAAVYRALTGRR